MTHEQYRIMLDGGGASVPTPPLDRWLVCDARAELMPRIRRSCGGLDVKPMITDFRAGGLAVEPMPVVHTSHPTFGYLMRVSGRRVVWAPEFWEFPEWARGAGLMFADAAGWQRPIRFAGGVGGHAAVSATAEQARRHGVARLVFAHIGRPVIRAIDAGQEPPYGEWGVEGRVYRP
ncbi:MBL fold metallo-hydrolase [Actinoallomurus iriomotensis]|uniref:MBL fold metallo-hydrolase n=1 Tax=Actinoallomurus iriomotensis TaxID=478107 RepID=UPI002553B95C|nr:MBL fold metallo-hydrolase [Actinoallomurus iriomotensis]